MKTTVTFVIDIDSLPHYADEYLAQLFHISQANPAAFGDKDACNLAEQVKAEIVRRWLKSAPVALWNHKGDHVHLEQLIKNNEGTQA